MITPSDVLDFWFAAETKAHWFNSTPSFDAEISQTFQAAAETLAKGPFPHPVWEADAQSALALIIMLDQFPRNMFRGSPQAFAWDGQALAVAERMLDRGWDMETPTSRRSFIYMPFMHAEDLTAQNRCVELSGSRLDDDGGTLRHAKAHRDVIERFGRFPHRNMVLGRESTPEEKAFLESGGYNPQ